MSEPPDIAAQLEHLDAAAAAEARLRYAVRRFAEARGLAVDLGMLELKLQDIYRQAEEAAE